MTPFRGALMREIATIVGWSLVGLLALPGCSSDDGGSSSATGQDASGADGTAADGSAADGTASDTGGATPLVANGDYLMGIKLSLGGAQLVMKLSVTAEGEAGAAGKFLTFDVYAANAFGFVSEAPIASGKDIAIAADGTFAVALGKVTVPGKASPTGTPVEADLTINGTVASDGTFCGDVTGEVPAFKADLKGSTFRAVPWPSEFPKEYDVVCPGAEAKRYDPIATCPKLAAGSNTMTSATFERTFELYLPAAATDTSTKLPIVFLYHGNTGNAKGIAEATGWNTYYETAGAIVVVPNTTPEVDGSKPVLDWRFAEKVFDRDNRELVFFDDLRKCVAEQYAVDADRLYVTGMSAGGMMTTFLALNRGEAIAAVAPLAGGYLHDFPDAARKVPFLVTWGGPTDMAYSQNFDTLAKGLIANLTEKGHVHHDCEHSLGHKIPPNYVGFVWSWLSAFDRDSKDDAHAGKLPAGAPDFCSVPK
ncbi:MAG: prolyl oligopeptidase family serine peptidase [Deltaproteobacteria bacterium]|nr:prolyl oligopeptidase family serine peptidase [Deltaproteobacteria bacterium]